MSTVYVMHDDGSTAVMSRIRCKNEDRELQRILEKNPDLLPGDQIDPDDPRRWLLLKREMPVPDPGNGTDRWSIDFLFADQDAMPTFVECKRCADTRARREIVGQMLEYAANGHHYGPRTSSAKLRLRRLKHPDPPLTTPSGSSRPAGKEDRPLAIDQWVPKSRQVAEIVSEVLADCRGLVNIEETDPKAYA
jgi:hypothetical protein